VTVSQGSQTVIKNVTFIIHGTKHNFEISTVFRVWLFDGTKCCGGCFSGILENFCKILMLNAFFDVTFLFAFGLFLRFDAARQTVHFGSKADKFHRRSGACFGFHLIKYSVIMR